jgi:hypothetical protein
LRLAEFPLQRFDGPMILSDRDHCLETGFCHGPA